MTTDLAFIMPWARVTTTKWNCPELFNLISLVFLIKPLTPVSDKDRISPYNFKGYNYKQTSNKNKEKY